MWYVDQYSTPLEILIMKIEEIAFCGLEVTEEMDGWRLSSWILSCWSFSVGLFFFFSFSSLFALIKQKSPTFQIYNLQIYWVFILNI